MGEVGNTVAEEPKAAQLKMNGELNGNHVDDQDEVMEVDTTPIDNKKILKDGENEPEVVAETNGNKDKNVIDGNNIVNGDNQVISKPEEITVPGLAEISEDGTMDSEKDALELPDDSNNKMDTNPVVLSDSSDDDSGTEDDGNSSSTSKFRSAERSAAVSESEGISNGGISTNHSKIDDDDDDKPVSIHSDSDEKDDCIMIDDLSKKRSDVSATTSVEPSPRRVRKSSMHAMTDFDDDIEEIVEDPLEMDANPAKRIKLSGTTITSVDLSRPSSSSSASSAYPVNLTMTNNRSSSSSTSQALNLTTKSGNSLLNPFATQVTSSSSSSSNATLLPNLTDDMFVLEAPSFIVPYIYEKPPTISLKTLVNEISKTITHRDSEKRRVDDETSGAESELNNQKSTESSDIDDRNKKAKDKNKSRRRGVTNGDESWDEYNTSTDDEASDGEKRTKVLIKESHADIESIKTHIISPDTISQSIIGENKNDSYFESPLGKFFMTIGVNMVQEYVQSDLLRQQKRRREKEGKAPSAVTQMAINSLQKSLEVSKENNAPFKHRMKRCDFCPFKTESELVLSQHYEIPHFKNNIYKCNYCEYESRPVHDILYHMEAIHNIKGRLEKPLSYHQCPNCPFEDNGKSKMVRHEAACAKKYKPEVNLCPPMDWEPPAKIPRIKAKHGLVGAATAYQAMALQQQQRVAQANAVAANINSLQRNNTAVMAAAAMKRGRQQNVTKQQRNTNPIRNSDQNYSKMNASLLQSNYQLAAATLAAANTQFLQQVVAQKLAMLNPAAAVAGNQMFMPNNIANNSSKKGSTPSISITPLPRQQQPQAGIKPGQSPNASGAKPQFVICEICDGYIKDLDQLRNHMQWIHKVKIHPKMIYNRPPLNCQKCQYRFFTDQGLERHLLGSHGLVTSSMQEAANNGKDAGRCPVCGKVFQWKLLNHVSRDHNMTLKPAHLSYKCTVCTATFGMYKLFENHVYSAHSTVAKKDNKNKSSTSTSSSSSSGNSLLKPLRINDEITIIPQPTKRSNDIESHIID
ncbi:CLUMA_CG015758, isoform B [Clunio marinus]|uniref:MOG interacting and ectopic P-granules protein 1 n=1 Tax=Clunio marinus TaxID=568069 RepID=A0A1J1ITL7_9DIPT|nr:CLUMA_CG015758, isoform B [Clunio marinus]